MAIVRIHELELAVTFGGKFAAEVIQKENGKWQLKISPVSPVDNWLTLGKARGYEPREFKNYRTPTDIALNAGIKEVLIIPSEAKK